jgi:hypothetical protein
MYTNYSGSNLNFSLYKGGKKSKSRSRTSRSRKRNMKGRGLSIFHSEPAAVKKISSSCEDTCLPEAKKFCATSCKSAALSSLEAKNTGLSKQFIESIEDRIKVLEKENASLKLENEKFKLREDIRRESRS